jgi:hypothetical protein
MRIVTGAAAGGSAAWLGGGEARRVAISRGSSGGRIRAGATRASPGAPDTSGAFIAGCHYRGGDFRRLNARCCRGLLPVIVRNGSRGSLNLPRLGRCGRFEQTIRRGRWEDRGIHLHLRFDLTPPRFPVRPPLFPGNRRSDRRFTLLDDLVPARARRNRGSRRSRFDARLREGRGPRLAHEQQIEIVHAHWTISR